MRFQDVGEKSATGQKKRRGITTKDDFTIGAWNIRTGLDFEQRKLVAKELLQYNISIAAISEVRKHGSGTELFHFLPEKTSAKLYWSGGEKSERGVGFVVSSDADKSVLAFQPYSDRIAVLTLAGKIKTNIVSVYAPTNSSSDASKDEFYGHLQEVLDSFSKSDMILLTGDFNAQTGEDRNGWEATLGNFGHGTINDNGIRLLSFTSFNNLMIGNSLFQHPLKHRLTWTNPRGEDCAVLDYVIINSRFRSSLKDVRVLRQPTCGSDHYLVRAKLRLRLRSFYKKTKPGPLKLSWGVLSDEAVKEKFQISLKNRFAALDDSDDVDRDEEIISKAILDCAQSLCPPVRRKKQRWISDECLDLVEQRKKAKLVNFVDYRRLHREVKKQIKLEREQYWADVAAEAEEAASRNEFHVLYRTLNMLAGKSSTINNNIKKRDGSFVKSTDERLERWKEYFEDLYNHDSPQASPFPTPTIEVPKFDFNDAEPTVDEVEEAVHSLGLGKAPGADQVTAEAVKAGGPILINRLHALFRKIWKSEQIPKAWKKAIIVPLHKKGDNRECSNYRGISLLSILGKVFMKIIQGRLQRHREYTGREEQAGFRPGRGCIDQIFAIRQILEERTRCGQKTIAVFIDFKSAFDCIHWPALWNTLRHEHVPQKMIGLLQAAYSGISSQVRIGNDLSPEFEVKSGVRHGDVASPGLFNAIMDAIMRTAFQNRTGVEYSQNCFISDLVFADDCVFFSDTEGEATEILNDISRAAQPYGLRINEAKTKMMTSDGSNADVFLEGIRIEQVQKFKYLGSMLEEGIVAATIDVNSRIGTATAAFATLKRGLWSRSNVSIKTKIRIYRTLVLPSLLYGSETWTLLKTDLDKLEVFQMRCLRRILGVSLLDRLTNESIRMRCQNQPTVDEMVQQRRLKWFGNVCRMSANRIPQRILWGERPQQWRVQRLAPKKTWTKQLEADLKNRRVTVEDAKVIAMDRKAWKALSAEVRNPPAPTTSYWLRK